MYDLTWDDAVVDFVALQLDYVGPVSLSGCKGVSDKITTAVLGELNRHNHPIPGGWLKRKRWPLDESRVSLHVEEREKAAGQEDDIGGG